MERKVASALCIQDKRLLTVNQGKLINEGFTIHTMKCYV
jgi:hypothetical protein